MTNEVASFSGCDGNLAFGRHDACDLGGPSLTDRIMWDR